MIMKNRKKIKKRKKKKIKIKIKRKLKINNQMKINFLLEGKSTSKPLKFKRNNHRKRLYKNSFMQMI